MPDLLLPLSVAEIVAVVGDATGIEPIGNDVIMVPAGTVTVVCTVALALLFARVTVVPPAAAGPPSVTVPVAPCPPATVPGATVRAITCRGRTVRVAVIGLFNVPVMVTAICEVTVVVITENAPVVWPAANEMLDEANVATVGALLESWTTAGPRGACVRVTTPATVAPPSTLVGGPIVMDCTCAVVGGSTVMGLEPDPVWFGDPFTVTV